MALSQQVVESLEEAQSSLRNALAYAARNERPMVSKCISELMCDIDKLKTLDELFDTIDNMKDGFTQNQ